MSLGLTRDSILDLSSLVPKSDEDTLLTVDSEIDGYDDDEFLILEELECNQQNSSNGAITPVPDDSGDNIDSALDVVDVSPVATSSSNLSTKVTHPETNTKHEPAPTQRPKNRSKSSKSYHSTTSSYYEHEAYNDTYAVTYAENKTKKKNKNFLNRIFPFCNPSHTDRDTDNDPVKEIMNPDTSTSEKSSIQNECNVIPKIFNTREVLKSKRGKGILKHTNKTQLFSDSDKNSISSKDTDDSKRRQLFPSYEPSTVVGNIDRNGQEKDSNLRVEFSAMARVMTVKSRADMNFMEKSQIWWQRSDFEDFKKAGRIISKAMIQGGSGIWLETSNAWGTKQLSSGKKEKSRPHSVEYENALKKYGVINGRSGEETKLDDNFSSKWWCKFGHSRRGLEHVVSTEEGRQRQLNVIASIKAVINEQRRQRITHTKNIDSIRSVSIQYSNLAKKLAIASGKADEEAVRSRFCIKAKCRKHYLQTGLNNHNDLMSSLLETAHSILSPDNGTITSLLDANTSSTLMLKEHERKSQAKKANSKLSILSKRSSSGSVNEETKDVKS